MVETKQGYIPQKGFLEKKLDQILKMYPNSKNQIPNFEIKEYNPLLDSSNMTPKDWNKIIIDIHNNYNKYDGFLIIHGTDTMAYTASALSFGLQNLQKPIVITGSQVALEVIKNDGQNNLLTSLIYLQKYSIPEVVIVFDNLILRGNRTRKVSPNKYKAFESPNYPPLGIFGTDIEINKNLVLKSSKNTDLTIQKFNENNQVFVFYLTPTLSNTILEDIANSSKIKGIILYSYGIGNGPTDNKRFMSNVKKITQKGKFIVNVSQTCSGRIDESDYGTGNALKEAGVISSIDMTLESAYTKLLYLLSKYTNKNEIIDNFQKPLVGELSIQPTELFN